MRSHFYEVQSISCSWIPLPTHIITCIELNYQKTESRNPAKNLTRIYTSRRIVEFRTCTFRTIYIRVYSVDYFPVLGSNGYLLLTFYKYKTNSEFARSSYRSITVRVLWPNAYVLYFFLSVSFTPLLITWLSLTSYSPSSNNFLPLKHLSPFTQWWMTTYIR